LHASITFEANSIQILAIRARIELAKNDDRRMNQAFIMQAVDLESLFGIRRVPGWAGGPIAGARKTKPPFTIG
jgi:hypothetical protein